MTTASMAKAIRYLEEGDWQSAHAIVQKDHSTIAAWAHGLVHWLEGDLPNARYWYRRAHRPLPLRETTQQEIAALKATLDARQKTSSVREAPMRRPPAAKSAARSAAVAVKAPRA